jgi:hypothetical protein
VTSIDTRCTTLNDRRCMAVVLNTSVPSSVLKKKHNVIAYHRKQQSLPAKLSCLAYVKSEEKESNILTEHSNKEKSHIL